MKDRTRIKQPKLNLVTVGRDSSFPYGREIKPNDKTMMRGKEKGYPLRKIGSVSHFGDWAPPTQSADLTHWDDIGKLESHAQKYSH